jgi:cell division control protein 6
MGILTNPQILLQDYDIGKIIDREEPIKQIKKLIVEPLIQEKVSNSIYVYGGPGTGKTYVVEKILAENLDLIKKHLPSFRSLWLNCREERTAYVVLTHIAKSLEEFLPIGKIDSIPLKGFDYGILLNDIIKKIVEKNRLELLIVLDEIDKIVYRDGDDLIYDLIYANKFLNSGHIYLIGISNDPDLESSFSSGVTERLKYLKIHFPKYDAKELTEILKVFAEMSLKSNTYEIEDLVRISSYVASVSGSAREAKRILYFIAEKSESKLDISKFEQAIEESSKLMFEKDIEMLPFHEKLVFFSVLKAYDFYQKSMQKSIGLKKFFYFPTTGKVYSVYEEVCRSYQEQPKSLTTFKSMIKDLDRAALIDVDIKSLGRRGLTSIIKPSKPVEVFEPMIKKVLK